MAGAYSKDLRDRVIDGQFRRSNTSADIAGRWRAEVDRRYAPGSQLRLALFFGTNDCTSENTSGPRLSHDTPLINARRI
jgi:hypothetical protein